MTLSIDLIMQTARKDSRRVGGMETRMLCDEIDRLRSLLQDYPIVAGSLTVTIQLGNSDDRLTQAEWSDFVSTTSAVVSPYILQRHFAGGSSWDAPWQNACLVCEVQESRRASLEQALVECRKRFKQQSVAVTWGWTKFL